MGSPEEKGETLTIRQEGQEPRVAEQSEKETEKGFALMD